MERYGNMEKSIMDTGNNSSQKVPPVSACDIRDLNSFTDVVNQLNDTIIKAMNETRNAKSSIKSLIIASAEEVKKALNLLPVVISSPPSTESLSDLKSEIKNEFASLRNEINKLKNTPSNPINVKTYAEITKKVSQTPTMPIPRKPAIIIKSNDPEINDVMDIWRKNISFKKQKYAPNNIYKINNKILKIEFENKQQCDETIQRVANITGINAEEARLKRPHIILKGISKEIDKEELLTIIACQNSIDKEKISLCYILKNRNETLYNAVLEVTPEIRKQLISNSRVNVDHQRVHVEDHSRFVQCYKCLQYGHTKTKCNSEIQICSHCASHEHSYLACPFKKDPSKLTCYNCNKSQNSQGNKDIIKHSATNIKQCPKILAAMTRIQQQIDYGI